MGIFSDFADQEEAARPPAAPFQDTVGGSLRKGWNAGLKGAESQIHSLAGAAGEALGADEFAASRNREATALQREAQAIGPTVTHSSQVNGLRSGLNYAAGLVGSSAPVSLAALGAAAVGGGGVVPAMLRAAAVTSPFEMGDVSQKIQADPQAMQRGAGERFGDAVVGGGVSALAQGVVPGLIGAKLAGAGARAAAGQSVGQILGRNVVGAGAMEGVAEGTGDAIKQYAANQDKALDWENIKENAIGGAVAGGAMGTIGAGADLTTRVAPQAMDAFGRARTSINDRVQAARTAAGDGAAAAGAIGGAADSTIAAGRAGLDQAADMVRSGAAAAKREFDAAAASETGQAIKGKFDAAAASPAGQAVGEAAAAVGKKGKALYERATAIHEKYKAKTDSERTAQLARGEDPDLDLTEVAKMTSEQVAARVQESDANAPSVMQRMADDIRSKLTPSDALSKQLDDALADVSDVGAAVKKVAVVKQAFDAAQSVKSRLDAALDDLKVKVEPAMGDARRWAAKKQAERSAASGKFNEGNTFEAETVVDQGDADTSNAPGKFVDEDAFTDPDAQPARSTINERKQLTLRRQAAEAGPVDDSVMDAALDESDAEPAMSPMQALKATRAARAELIAAAKARGGTEEDGAADFREMQAGGKRITPEEARAYTKEKYGSKQSLDDSGTQAVILQALQESGIGTRRKEFFELAGNISKLGTLLRSAVEQMASGKADRKLHTTMINVLGQDAEPLVDLIRQKMLGELGPKEAEHYFNSLAAMADVEKQDTDLNDSLGQLMVGRSLSLPQHEVRELMDLFVEHAQSNTESPTNMRNMSDLAIGSGKAQRLAESRAVDKLYKQHFGDNSDAAYRAVEKHVKSLYRQAKDPLSTAPVEMGEDGNVFDPDDTEVMTAEIESMTGGEPVFDEEGNRIEEAPTDVQQWGLSAPDKKGNRKVVRNGLPYIEGDAKSMSYAKQHLKDVKAKFPKMDVRMEDGYIVAEERDNPFVFSEADLTDMSLDTNKHSRSESRIEIQGTKKAADGTAKPHKWIIDSVKVAKLIRKKNLSDFEDASPKTRMQKTVESFKQGFAQLEEQFGVQRPDPPVRGATPQERAANRAVTDAAYAENVMAKYDKVIIGYIGDKAVTWGKARKMSFRNEADEKRDARAKELQDMRDDYAAAQEAGDTEMMDAVLESAQRHISQDEAIKNRELVGDSKSLTDYGAGNIGPRSNDNNKIDDREKSYGEYGTSPFAQSEAEGTMRAVVLALERAEIKAEVAGKELSASQRRFIANKVISTYNSKKANVGNDGGGRFRPVPVDEDGNEITGRYGAQVGGELNREGITDLLSGAADGGIDVRSQARREREGRTLKADKLGNRTKGFGPRTLTDEGQLLMPFGDAPSKGGALAGTAGLGQQRRNLADARDSEQRGPLREEDSGAVDPTDFYTDEQLAFIGGTRERSGRSATINERRKAREVRERIDPAAGEGRRKVGKDENISLAAAVLSAEELITRSNMDGSKHWVSDREVPRHSALTIMALNWANEPGSRGIGKRLQTLLTNIYSYSEADRNKLMSILPEPDLQQRQKNKMDSKIKYGDRNNAADTLYGNLEKMSQGERGVELRRRERMVEDNDMAWENSDGQRGKYDEDLIEMVKEEIEILKVYKGPKDVTPESALPIINEIAQKYRDAIVAPGVGSQSTSVEGASARLKGKAAAVQYPQNPVQFKNGKAVRSTINSRVATANQTTRAAPAPAPREGTPDPKAVAAKKAAFLKRAASGDKALIQELSASTDAKGLQRAVQALIATDFDGVSENDASADNVMAVLEAINDRLAELVQDPDVAYGLQTRKYSLMANAVHESLGRPGFAATHDSPIRHEGKFDWRKYTGTGEGVAAFGAGTYLSTADGVHKSYKSQFTADVQPESEYDVINRVVKAIRTTVGVRASIIRDAADKLVYGGNKKRVVDYIRKTLSDHIEDGVEGTTSQAEFDKWTDIYSRVLEAFEAMPDAEMMSRASSGFRNDRSPTYEVSVDIPPDQLLNWNAPLSEQSELVQKIIADKLGDYVEKDSSQVAELKKELAEVTEARRVYREKDDKTYPKEVWDAWSDSTLPKSVERSIAERKFTSQLGGIQKKIDNLLRENSGKKLYERITDEFESQAEASEYLQSLGILGHKFAAAGGRNDVHPNYVIYDDSKITTNYVHFSKEKTNPGTTNTTGSAPEIKAYIERVLGPTVKLAWRKMTHAGDFTRMKTHDLIRISVHALDPMSVAYHESLHGFFAKLRDAGATDIIAVLEKAAASPQVMAQLQERFKDQPAVLQQLKDPEERAAYMYQMWANDPTGFKVSPAARGTFRKIAAFIRNVLGMWTNDERALHIMEYFHDGSYAKNMASPHAVRGALMAPGHNKSVEAMQRLAEPLANLADAVGGTGSGRLRDTNIPSLIRLADLIKRPGTQKGGDQGFIAAARIEATKRRGEVGMIFENFNEDALNDAMNSLQAVKPARTADGRAAAEMVKAFLQSTRAYMKQAGTDIGDLGPDYFPRVWDAHYISQNQQAFKDMLEPYIRSGEMQGSAEQLIRNLTSRDGNEFGIETHVPGMQHKKSRVLNFIKAGDAAQFLKKDLASTLNDYLTQATRRAEWDRRFGWDNKANQTKLNTLFIDAKSEGATDAQLEMAKDYLKGIDGTLGDSINPDVRRVMGNMIVYQNVRLLPMAIFSMAVDPMGQMVRGGSLAQSYDTLVRGIKSIPESWGGKVRRDEATELAELVGVVDSAVMNTVMGDIYTQGMVGGTARKINDKFFKLNLVEGMTRAFRVGASQAAMDFMKRHADPLKNTHSVRWMAELGIQAGDIQMGSDGKRIALTQAEGLSEAQERRVHAAINQWVDGAMLRPDAADKPIWMNDPRFALISHLKQFIFAFQKTILARVAHEAKHGNYSPVMTLAMYVPVMMAVDTAKGLLQTGGEVPEWKKGWGPAEYTGYAMERAGLFGVGQFGLDMAQESEYGGFAPIGVAGPTIEQLTDVVQVMGGDKQFGGVLLNSMPANALYRNIVDQDVQSDSGATLPN